MMNPEMRAVLAELAREHMSESRPGVSVLTIYDPDVGAPDAEQVSRAARGRRVTTMICMPDNGRDTTLGALPVFHVAEPNGAGWSTDATGKEIGR